MLLANIAVAQRIVQAFPRFAMLRRHPVPSRRRFDPLIAAAEAVGVSLDVSTSKVSITTLSLHPTQAICHDLC